ALWSYLDVEYVGSAGPTIAPVADVSIDIDTTANVAVGITDPDGDALTVGVGTSPDASDFVTEQIIENAPGDYTVSLDLAPESADLGNYTVTISADDGTNPPVEEVFVISVVEPGVDPVVLYRVNAGGGELAAADGSVPNWTEDAPTASPYRVPNGAGADVYSSSAGSAHPGPIVMTDPSLPPGAPASLFETERYDIAAAPEMQWQFPVDPGAEIEVRLYFAELFSGVDLAGERVFDVSVEGTVPSEFDDIDQIAIAGAKGAFMRSTTLVAADDTLDLEFIHDVIENPAIKGIEILEIAPAPANTPPTVGAIADQSIGEGALFSLGVVADDVDAGATLTYALSGDVPEGMAIDAAGLVEFTPDFDDSGSYSVTVEVSDGTATVTEDFVLSVSQTDSGTVLARVNVGGPAVAPDWDVDSDNAANASPFRTTTGGASLFSSTSNNGVPVNNFDDPTVPTSTPNDVFQTERWDPAAAPAMIWEFPVDAGAIVEVRVGIAEIFGPNAGRQFDVLIDGEVVQAAVDPTALAGGQQTAYVLDYVVTGDGDGLQLAFAHTVPAVDNPSIKSIEVIDLTPSTNGAPSFDTALADAAIFETQPYSFTVDASDPDLDPLTYAFVGSVPVGMTIDASTGLVDWTPGYADSGRYDITISVSDGVNPAVTDSYTLDVGQTAPPGSALFRVNAGGPTVAAADATYPDWEEDTTSSPSPYLVTSNGNINGGPLVDRSHPSVPGTAPDSVFETERWGSTMSYAFPVDAGTEVEVRILLSETYAPAATSSGRQFDVLLDGAVVASAVEPFVAGGQGFASAADFLVTSDGQIDISFGVVADNPAIKGIEILGVGGQPSVSILGGLDGSTITSDTLTVEWMYSGFIDPSDHVHFELDGGPATDPPNDETVNGAGTHNTIIRPDTSISLSGLSAGTHTVTAQVADVGHVEYGNAESLASATFTVDLGPVVQSALAVDHHAYGPALFRVNAGGPAIGALDGGIGWEADTSGSPSPYQIGGPPNISTTTATPTLSPSVPATTPPSVFQTERWDPPTGAEMAWDFPVSEGTPVEVRLYFADFNVPTQTTGARVFDVSIDGRLVLPSYDIFDAVGANTGAMEAFAVIADADGVDIDFQRIVENTEIRAIEIVSLVGAATSTAGDVDVITVVTNPADNSEDAVVTDVVSTVTGPGLDGTPASVAPTCSLAVPVELAPGGSLECRYAVDVPGVPGEEYSSAAGVTASFAGGQLADATSASVVVTVAAPAIVTTRINAGGALVAASDGGPDWAADNSPNHPTLTVPSGSSVGSFPITNGYDASVPGYAQIDGLYTAERWDGTNGAAPDDMTFAIPVSQAGAAATVNLFMMSGWDGASAIGQREFDVYVEGILVLDEFDIVDAYGHQVGGMETFPVTDDGDGVITVVFEHGVGPQNPVVNALEVIG
ncbi:MAG: malectin domain-containing carbohydrate-binding protein, partial [Ilumatobacteraceae bacterium]